MLQSQIKFLTEPEPESATEPATEPEPEPEPDLAIEKAQ